MAINVLFIVEGASYEKSFGNAVLGVLGLKERVHVHSYCTNFLALYRDLIKYSKKTDPDSIDTIPFLLERRVTSKVEKAFLEKEKFQYIYLLFDYDHHVPSKTSEDKRKAYLFLLKHFDNETEHGKIYFNYPMMESICDVSNSTKSLQIGKSKINPKTACSLGVGYKALVSQRGITDSFTKFSESDFAYLAKLAIIQALTILGRPTINIVFDDYLRINQSDLEKKIYVNWITKKNPSIPVLNSSLFIIVDYFGQKSFDAIFNDLLLRYR